MLQSIDSIEDAPPQKKKSFPPKKRTIEQCFHPSKAQSAAAVQLSPGHFEVSLAVARPAPSRAPQPFDVLAHHM